MEWVLFTYWLPPEPSRKRVFLWRQLKKLGALSIEGGGWLLPKREPLSSNIVELARAVEEMGGSTNIYIVTHFTEAQEQRTVAKFRDEREREYAELIKECQKALQHIERENEEQQFNFEEVEELEGDLAKINRWFSNIKERDFGDAPARKDAEKLLAEVEAALAAFIQKTYEKSES